MSKLAMSLGFLGVFVLGCVTASVLVTTAAATPASGSYQCTAFNVPFLAYGNAHMDKGKVKAETDGLWLPEGWTPVGGTSSGGSAAVIACRTAP